MGITGWIFFGLVAGIVAKLLMPGRDPGGCIITMLLGVAGAFLGGFFYEVLTGNQAYMTFDLPSLVTAIIGSLVILLIYRVIIGRRT